jgi:versiconal hemiacetal acetate esterase
MTGQLFASIASPPDKAVSSRDHELDNGLVVRIYTPVAKPGDPLPLGVYYHGGGFILGSLDAEDADCRYFVKSKPCVIVSVGYNRCGIGNRFKKLLEDSVLGYEWASRRKPAILLRC